jgi:hypothetical protein
MKSVVFLESVSKYATKMLITIKAAIVSIKDKTNNPQL